MMRAVLIIVLLSVAAGSTRIALADNYAFELLPREAMFPVYIADPYRPAFSAQNVVLEEAPGAEISKHRFDLKIGGPLVMAEWSQGDARSARQRRGYQFVIEAGFHGQFDVSNSQDNTGWDGIYGFYGLYRPAPTLAFRAGIHHISSHIGDELIERSGRTRINYTRQELRLGMAWQPGPRLSAYLDGGYGTDLRNDELQQPWRVQAGAQYESQTRWWHERIGWYAALDLSAFEEDSWRRNITVQGGVVLPVEARRLRIGLEYYDGRGQIGELNDLEERYLGLGVWLDI